MKKLTAILIGAGNRGASYAKHMKKMAEQYQIVGIAEPHETDRAYICDLFSIPQEHCYDSWEKILAQPKMADLAMICTLDDMHLQPALKAIQLGYDLLLEKPVAMRAEDCAAIANAAKEKGVKVLVCHVLRYTDFYGRIKQLLMDGTIGQVVSVDLVEAVGHTHFAHSFVRGNWRNEDISAPMLLAKCCHDLDIVQWLVDKPCQRVSSFGSLTHFTKENAPEGAPVRCVETQCPARDTCPYDCMKFYARTNDNLKQIVASGIAVDRENPTWEEILEGLRTKNYGQCVYHSNNDLVDHQIVNMEFSGGITATLTMNAFNRGGRYIRIYGTKGELYAHMGAKEIQLFTFDERKQWTTPMQICDEHITGGHGGGDSGIIRELHAYMSDCYDGFRAADIQVSVRNHMIGFAAEKARLTGTVVDVQEFMKEYNL